MSEMIKPVRYGVLVGLLGIVFGIGWAFFLALNEDAIGKGLNAEMKQDISGRQEVMKISLKRLGMGHSHSLALGLLTIAASIVLAFTGAPQKAKTAGSILLGIGGLLFPAAWIIMGYRTPLLGPEGAHESIIPMAGASVMLILTGLFITIGFLLKDILKKA